jgi:hypothetical protein
LCASLAETVKQASPAEWGVYAGSPTLFHLPCFTP